jgi:hypothetical protein
MLHPTLLAEIHLEIIKHLTFPDTIHLQRTCRFFNNLIPFTHADQPIAETTPAWHAAASVPCNISPT